VKGGGGGEKSRIQYDFEAQSRNQYVRFLGSNHIADQLLIKRCLLIMRRKDFTVS